ncbi:MAG: ABC transporter permease [Porphyromonadaceae bacterium CG2_30_38_12]|nr:MAG: ABC transporter permease [Porphyromonadaceae bacterium CG2_30_38_12]
MLKYLLKKEFRQIKRNAILPRMIFVFPFMVLMVFPWAASYEIKNLNISIVDSDHSSLSNQLVQKIISSNYFRLTDVSDSYSQAMQSIESKKADVMLQIPANLEKNIITGQGSKVMISANAVNGMKGGIAMTYLVNIIQDFNTDFLVHSQPAIKLGTGISILQTTTQYRFNPHLNYRVFMVPALMVMILSLLCGFLPAVSIVFEKELGTMEQMNVTPVPRITFIVAKLIPFWIVGTIVINIGFVVAWFVYGLIPAGHFLTIYFFTFIFILTMSGIGLIISNFAQTLQQAMFVVFFFMLIFIMLSGLYTPIESMPEWAKWIAAFNPLKYFMDVMRSVYLKGSDIGQLWKQLAALVAFALTFNIFAVLSYRKSS